MFRSCAHEGLHREPSVYEAAGATIMQHRRASNPNVKHGWTMGTDAPRERVTESYGETTSPSSNAISVIGAENELGHACGTQPLRQQPLLHKAVLQQPLLQHLRPQPAPQPCHIMFGMPIRIDKQSDNNPRKRCNVASRKRLRAQHRATQTNQCNCKCRQPMDRAPGASHHWIVASNAKNK